jgi:hypothetical protein
MGFGANISPTDTLNYTLRNLAEAVNFYTNIKAIGEDVWLYKPPQRVLTKYVQDQMSHAVGIDGSFKGSTYYSKKYDYDPSKELSKYPLIFISYDRPFTLTEDEKINLANYIFSGGFIIIDNPLPEIGNGCVGNSLKNIIIDAFNELIEKSSSAPPIIPELSYKPIPKDHELFHCFFDFNNGPPGGYWSDADTKNIIEGMDLGGRLISLYVPGYGLSWNDRRNEEQLKMGVNMVVYALKQGKGRYDLGSVMFPGTGKMINLNKSNVKAW